MRPNLPMLLAGAILCVPVAINATENEHVGRNLEKGEPSRWFVPDITPREKYDTAVKEASAALAEALQECKREGDRKACETQARAQHAREMTKARSLLPKA